MSCRKEFLELWRSEDQQDRLAGQTGRTGSKAGAESKK